MNEQNPVPRSYAPERYALSGKIMLSAIVILFSVVILIICLHIYVRWFLARSRRRQLLLNRSRRRRAHIIFTSDIPSSTISHGLDAAILKSLPTFVFSSKTEQEVIECAVCLSEFEENEKGRLLPKCNHSFHTACIDMWFHSHSTCPLCRSPVDSAEIPKLKTESVTQIEVVVQQTENFSSESSNCEEHQMGHPSSSSSSSNSSDLTLGSRRRGFELMGVSIEVPRRNENFKNIEEEIQKSPGGRIMSFKRMLSRASRPSTPLSCTSYPALEIDLERGGGGGVEEEEEVRAATPANQTMASSGTLRVGP